MSPHDLIEQAAPTVAEAREHLALLRAERDAAVSAGMTRIEAYMTDLDREIETWRHLYVISAVTELAVLDAQLFGVRVG